jgi:hypothetical protein
MNISCQPCLSGRGRSTEIVLYIYRDLGRDKRLARFCYIAGLLNFVVLIKMLFGGHLKHSSFCPLADVKPLSNNLVH